MAHRRLCAGARYGGENRLGRGARTHGGFAPRLRRVAKRRLRQTCEASNSRRCGTAIITAGDIWFATIPAVGPRRPEDWSDNAENACKLAYAMIGGKYIRR